MFAHFRMSPPYDFEGGDRSEVPSHQYELRRHFSYSAPSQNNVHCITILDGAQGPLAQYRHSARTAASSATSRSCRTVNVSPVSALRIQSVDRRHFGRRSTEATGPDNFLRIARDTPGARHLLAPEFSVSFMADFIGQKPVQRVLARDTARDVWNQCARTSRNLRSSLIPDIRP